MTYRAIDSDVFTGRKSQIKRYLVSSLQGYFPVLVKTGPNRLACVYRVGGVHISISATLAVSVSEDGGRSWSEGVNVAPQGEDNRNAALGANEDGELIVAYWKSMLDKYYETPNGLEWDNEKQPSGETPSMYISIGSPAGDRWTEMQPYRSELLTFVSPYGRIIPSRKGELLMPAYGPRRERVAGVRDTAILLRSTDGGKTWGDESVLSDLLNEFSICYTRSGSLIAAARSEGGGVSIISSDDDGRTWSAPEKLTRNGEHPADITALQNGDVLLTFGRRIRPFGCGALLSHDGGRTWDADREVLLAGDGVRNTDLGYPSTVQLDDGSIVTVMYYASGSQASDDTKHGWGEISCQALVYSEALFTI